MRFAEAATVFEDEAALTMADDDPNEERFVALGIGSMGRILVVIYTTREDRIRIISARKATRQERSQYESRRR
ncbi:MAG: BrnT family toxin [Candidatus Binataceae bacterium]